ncbi:putative integral membrane protein [Tropheryma whipplei TW08/27]|nr:putative integral membrane protein [Tropheryma whipplei TW08/27]
MAYELHNLLHCAVPYDLLVFSRYIAFTVVAVSPIFWLIPGNYALL